jgi:hypothetical protein
MLFLGDHSTKISSPSCRKNDTLPSYEDGFYDLMTCSGFHKLTVKAEGYKPLTCHIEIPKEPALLLKNMPLLPNEQNIPAPLPSKTVYHHGNRLHVQFQASLLPPQSCVRYYFAIAYPDGQFFILTDLNRFEPLNPAFLPYWLGTGNRLIDKPIDDDMPRGDYQLYILRMPEGITDPINNLDKGELNVSQFRIE